MLRPLVRSGPLMLCLGTAFFLLLLYCPEPISRIKDQAIPPNFEMPFLHYDRELRKNGGIGFVWHGAPASNGNFSGRSPECGLSHAFQRFCRFAPLAG